MISCRVRETGDKSAGRRLTLLGWGGILRDPMRRSRHVIAVIVVATALSADRVANAAPQAKPQVTQLARTLANKLSTGLQRVVPAVRLVQDRREGETQQVVSHLVNEVITPLIHPAQGTPFSFRLPPPTL